ncbi:MAG: (2Fe-2S) ferredoxin domain-containing protein [Microcoleaceae cyanobacterium]
MSKNYRQTLDFHLEGTIQELFFDKHQRVKYLQIITINHEFFLVKLSKNLLHENFALIPGLKILLAGKKSIDFATQEIKFKADYLLPIRDLQKSLAPIPVNDLVQVGSSIANTQSTGYSYLSSQHSSPEKSYYLLPNLPQLEINLPLNNLSEKSSNTVKSGKILICEKSDCKKRGANKVCRAITDLLTDYNLTEQVTIEKTGCLKQCKSGPNLIIKPDKARYHQVKVQDVPDIMTKHFNI